LIDREIWPPVAMHPVQRRKFCAMGAGVVEQGERPGAVGPPILVVRKGAVKREAEDLEGGGCCGQGRDDGVQVWRQASATEADSSSARRTGRQGRSRGSSNT
jgi:hypothetical protein